MIFRTPNALKFGLVILLFMTFSMVLEAQPNTEVYMFDLSFKDGKAAISSPKNISNNDGYDNQPAFHPNGSYLYYSSERGGQTEIMAYSTMTGSRSALTESKGSEYSPIVTPNAEYLSTIILKPSGEQLLWKYSLETGGKAQLVIPDLVVGYHCWYDDKTVFSFVLGTPSTLQRSDLKKKKNEILAYNIGRSLHKVPGEKLISYIQKDSLKDWTINTYNPKSKETKTLISTLDGSEDYAWTTDGKIIMGQQSSLFIFDPEKDEDWVKFADLTDFDLQGITRLAVSTFGRNIAVVVEEE